MQNLNTRRAAENNCCFAVWSVAKAKRILIAESGHTKWAKLIALCPTLVSFMWHFCPKTNESSRAKFPKTGTNRSVFRFQCRPQSDLNNLLLLLLGASEYYAWARMHERRWVSVGLCIKMSVQLAERGCIETLPTIIIHCSSFNFLEQNKNSDLFSPCYIYRTSNSSFVNVNMHNKLC